MAYINYILLDASAMGNEIEVAKSYGEDTLSLFSGKSEGELANVAPYLIRYNPKSKFADWFMDNGWGKGWGIMLRSGAPLEELHNHCRKFLVKADNDGQEFYFRYYDPRVLSIFLPTCTRDQLKEFFGPIDYIMIEDIDPNFAQLIWLENYRLFIKAIGKEELMKRFRAHDAFSGEQFESASSKDIAPDEIKPSAVIPENPAPNNTIHIKALDDAQISPLVATKEEVHSSKKWLKFFFDEEHTSAD